MEANSNTTATPATTPNAEATHRERIEADPRLVTAGWMLVHLCGFSTKEAARLIECRTDTLCSVLLDHTPAMQQLARLPLALACVELRRQAMEPAAA